MKRLCACLLLLSLFGVEVCDAIQPGCGAEFFQDNFEGPARTEWSSGALGSAPNGARILGPFGNSAVSLTLANLPDKYSVSVAFDLYVIGSWDGNADNGDVWELNIAGVSAPLRSTTFSNHPVGGGNRQAFPNDYRQGDSDPGSSAMEFRPDPDNFALYRLQVTTSGPSGGGALTLIFSGKNLASDETWGLKNVSVSVTSFSPPRITTQPMSRSVPEDSSVSFVVVGDAGAKDYQWLFKGSPIDGARNSAFILNNVQVKNAGAYSVLVSNCAGSILSAPAILTVISNTPPTIAGLRDQTINEDASLSALPFTVTDKETSGDILAVAGNSSNPALVPKANIQFVGAGNNRAVTVTPAANEFGETVISVVVADERGLTATNLFRLTVTPVNDKPILDTIADLKLSGASPSQTVEITGIGPGAPNETNQTLTVIAQSTNPALVPNPLVEYRSPDATGRLTITPVAGQSGSARITVAVLDDGITNNFFSRTFTVTVPELEGPPTISIIADQTTFEDTPTTNIAFVIADGRASADGLRLTAASSDLNLVPVENIVFIGTGTNRAVRVTPVRDLSGESIIAVTVTDETGLSATNSFHVTVLPVNDAPVLAQFPKTVSILEDSGEQSVPLAEINAGGGETQNLRVLAISSNPAVVWNPTVVYESPSTAGRLILVPLTNAIGSSVITVVLQDDGGTANGGMDAVTNRFTVTVSLVNDPPTLGPLEDVVINEDAPSQTVKLTGITSGATNENQTLSIKAISSDTNVISNLIVSYVNPNSNGTLTLKPQANAFGKVTIGVVVDDGQGASNTVTRTFDVTINPVNDPPTLNSMADFNISEDAPLQSVNLGGIGSGAPNEVQQLTVTARSSNPALIPDPVTTYASPNSSGTLSFQPRTNANGLATITVVVRDNGGTERGGVDAVTNFFTVKVSAVNDPPTLDTVVELALRRNAPPQTVPLTGLSSGDPEEPATLTVLAFSNNPALITNLVVNYTPPSLTGALAFNLVSNAIGTAQINVVVNDGNSSIFRSIKVSVEATNSPPEISRVSDQFIDEDMTTGAVAFTISDAESLATSLSLAAGSSNPILVPIQNIVLGGLGTNRFLTLKPATNQFGTATITLTVSDEGGLTNQSKFLVDVRSVNDAPTITGIADQLIPQNGATDPLAFAVADLETSADKLSVSGSSSNTELIPNASLLFGGSGANRTVTITPALNRSGTAAINLTVRDADGLSATNSFQVTVTAGNQPPAVTLLQPLNGAAFSAPATISIEVVASDADGKIAKLELFQGDIKLAEGTASPLSFVWTSVPVGDYGLVAKATDNSGLVSTSAPVNVTVKVAANFPPTVVLTNPANRSTYPPDSRIVLAATATDPDGAVQRVEFYAGSTLLGTSAASPYAFTWENPSVGDYSLTAKAIDNQGAESVSTPVLIAVSEVARGDVAIVRNFPGPEIDKLQEHLFEMGLTSQVFDRAGLTAETLAKFQLIVWDDLGAAGLTDREVALFSQASQAGIPLYFIGEKLTAVTANLSATQRGRWTDLIHLGQTAGTTGSAAVSLDVSAWFHPILRGRFGVVQDFTYPSPLEGTTTAGAASTQVLGQSGSADVLVAFPHLDEGDLGQTRVVTQTWLVAAGSDASSLEERKRLFQNAVCWLLRCPGCVSVDLRLEMSSSVESVPLGGEFVYELLVHHSGECEGGGVVVTDALPPQLKFVSAETAQGSWSEAAGVVTFKVGHVPNGSATRLAVTVRPVFPGTITNEARLRSFNSEVSLENNLSSVVTVVDGPAQPILEIKPLANGQVRIQVLGELNRNYALQVSTNLVDWKTWTNFVSAGGATQFVEPETATTRQRFYRVTAR